MELISSITKVIIQKKSSVSSGGAQSFRGTAAQAVPARTRKRCQVKFDAKTCGNLGKHQKRSSPYFYAIFAGILGGDQTK